MYTVIGNYTVSVLVSKDPKLACVYTVYTEPMGVEFSFLTGVNFSNIMKQYVIVEAKVLMNHHIFITCSLAMCYVYG